MINNEENNSRGLVHPFSDVKTILLASTVAGIISAYFARRQGKNPLFWFLIGFLFGCFGVFALFFCMPKKRKAPKPTVKAPEPSLMGPSDKFWYYLDTAHQQVGPVSYHKIKNSWKEGTLPLTAFVWHEEMSDWKPLQELIEIAPKNSLNPS